MKNKKNLTIEMLRIIACFLVIVCHTNGWGFDKLTFNLPWFLSIGIYLISKTAVPIFFMITGALYLKKDYSYKEMLKKIFFRIVVPLVLFSAIRYFKDYRQISLRNFMRFLKNLLSAKILIHYWFLYALMGLYLIIPFIRKMILNFENKDYIIFFTIWIGFSGILPIIQHYGAFTITSNFDIPLVAGYIGYLILGHYMLNYININKNKKKLFINIIILVLSIIVSTIITYFENMRINQTTVFLDKLNYISIILPTINIVYITRYIFENIKPKEKIENLIINIGATTFGIYLTHWMILGKVQYLMNIFLDLNIHKFIATTIIQFIIFVIMVIGIYLIRKIPIVKKII